LGKQVVIRANINFSKYTSRYTPHFSKIFLRQMLQLLLVILLSWLQACTGQESTMRMVRQLQKQMKQEDIKRFGIQCEELRERVKRAQETNFQAVGLTLQERSEMAADIVFGTPLFGARLTRSATYLDAIGTSLELERNARIGYWAVVGDVLSQHGETQKDLVIGGVYDAWLRDIAASKACQDRVLYDWPCAPFIPPARCEKFQQALDDKTFNELLKQLRAAAQKGRK
jgi:hypothetical protein